MRMVNNERILVLALFALAALGIDAFATVQRPGINADGQSPGIEANVHKPDAILAVSNSSTQEVAEPLAGAEFERQEPRVRNGDTAAYNEFPFVLQIGHRPVEDVSIDWTCTGSLIHKNWVLTAAHCLVSGYDNNQKPVLRQRKVEVRYNRGDGTTTSYRFYWGSVSPSQVHIHPEFRGKSNNWKMDLALLRLEDKPQGWGRGTICPTCVAHSPYPIKPIEIAAWVPKKDNLVKVAGFGRTENGRHNRLDPPDWAEVKVDSVNWTSSLLSYTMTKEFGKTACYGDSGGPIFRTSGGQYEQVAVVTAVFYYGDPQPYCESVHRSINTLLPGEGCAWIYDTTDHAVGAGCRLCEVNAISPDGAYFQAYPECISAVFGSMNPTAQLSVRHCRDAVCEVRPIRMWGSRGSWNWQGTVVQGAWHGRRDPYSSRRVGDWAVGDTIAVVV